jgi:hypothetical protein
MKRLLKQLLAISGVAFILVGCEAIDKIDENGVNTETGYVESQDEVAFEQMMADIDNDVTLGVGNSLNYSKSDGASVSVEIHMDSTKQMVKLVESYTKTGAPSICTNIFYLKNGKKFASRELFEEGSGDQLHFTERISYYDVAEKPVITKQRHASFEGELDAETFIMARKQDCSMQRGFDAINQQGEFVTTFQGFIESPQQGYFLLVGENKEGGYTSSLSVQHIDEVVKKLMDNETDMKGKPLNVIFEMKTGGDGFKFQLLKIVHIVE